MPVNEDEEDTALSNHVDELRLGRTLGIDAYTNSYVNVLLLFVPLGLLWGVMAWSPTWCFTFCFLSLIPLACIVGRSTEDIAEQTSETVRLREKS
jgi:hypothetical protein